MAAVGSMAITRSMAAVGPMSQLVSEVPSFMVHSFGTFAAAAVVAAIKAYSAVINSIGCTWKLLQMILEVARTVLGDETMRIIDTVINNLRDIYPRRCTIAELTTTMFTLVLCQLRSGPHIMHHGRPYMKGEDTRLMQLFSRFSIYACAAYGQPPEKENPVGTSSERILDTAGKNLFIEKEIGLDPTRIYPYVDETEVAGLARLEHFVAADDAYFRVVLSLKGTNSIEAAIKALDAGYYEATIWGERYQVHQGMWNSAMDLLSANATLQQIRDELRAHPRYSLAIVGHSLGGGVAALLTILLSQPTPTGRFETNDHTLEGREIECFAIGSGACMDSSLGQKTKSMIYTLVNGYDVIPYLSLGVVSDFCAMTKKVWSEPGRLMRIMRDLLREETPPAVILEHLMYFKKSARSKRLVPPGRVWVIVYNLAGDAENVEEVTNVQERFGYISMRQKLRLITDHILSNKDSISSKLERFCE